MFLKSKDRKLLGFLRYQRYLGLNDIDYSKQLQRYIVHFDCYSGLSQLLVLLIVCGSLHGTLTGQCVYNPEMISKPVKAFYYLHLLMPPIIQILLNICLRSRQQRQRVLLQRMSLLAQRLLLNTEALPCPRWLYRLCLGSSTFYILHLTMFAMIFDDYCHQIQIIFYYICFFLHIIRKNFIITCYTSLVNVASNLLQAQAAQLSRALPGIHVDKLANYLQTHDEILLMCHEELVDVFGIALLVCLIFICQNSIFVAYLATLKSRFDYINILGILTWMTVNIIFMYMPLKINNLAYEVSSQAKYLAFIIPSIASWSSFLIFVILDQL